MSSLETPMITKAPSRMEQGQAQSCQNHHCSLEYHERNFLISQAAAKAILKLRNTVAATDEDEDRCDADS
jgi:hypothetical protein